MYDFDTVIDRRGTGSLKYDLAVRRGKPADVLPMWVADMDFQTAPQITKRLEGVVQHAIYGYTEPDESYFEALKNWYGTRFGWEVRRPWLVKTPGVVFALAEAVRAFTEPGDAVLIQQPVYYPFAGVIEENDRVLVNSPLQLIDGHYEIDFEDFEQKIVENQVKLFLLCSPHNPVGRVWKEEELRRLGEICLAHGVIVTSDEIHSDFTFPGHTHHIFASLGERFADISVICTAPSKTFNLAGLQVSNIWIPNPQLRRKFRRAVEQTGYSQLNTVGLAACQAAYEEGGPWLEELKAYLVSNLDFMREFLKTETPELHLIEPDGTYLIWVDFRDLGMTEDEREVFILKEAKLWLDSGAIFGPDGEGFERFNIACPRATLTQALVQLRDALRKRSIS